jgi:DNA-binding transcriptional LysR family regulator
LYTLVVKTGSISKAAQFTNLAIGAASKRISDLELALGTGLLARHSRGVTATLAGEALYRHAQRILEDVDQLTVDLSDAAGIDGVVSLWANTSAITQFLPGDIPSFMTQNPRIRIELEEQNSTDVVMAVLDGRADFGIFADRTPELGLQTITYRWDKLVLVVPNGHPLTARSGINFAEALEYDFVAFSKDTSLYSRVRLETKAVGKRLKVHIQVRSFDAMCLMVEAIGALQNEGLVVTKRNSGTYVAPAASERLLNGGSDHGGQNAEPDFSPTGTLETRFILEPAIARRAAARGKRDRLAEQYLAEMETIHDITNLEERALWNNSDRLFHGCVALRMAGRGSFDMVRTAYVTSE